MKITEKQPEYCLFHYHKCPLKIRFKRTCSPSGAHLNAKQI